MSEMQGPTAFRERRLGESNSRHPCSTYNKVNGTSDKLKCVTHFYNDGHRDGDCREGDETVRLQTKLGAKCPELVSR